MPATITVVGSLNMDLVVRAPRMPGPGETVMGSEFRTIPGGKGANQAVGAARLGARVSMVGRVGNDDFGRAQIRNLSVLGIDTSRIMVDQEEPTGIALITLDAGGQNSIVLAPGANMQLTQEDIDESRHILSRSQILCLQLESPLPVVRHAIALARDLHVPIVLNPAPAPEEALEPGMLSQVDYLIPNEFETSVLSGIDVTATTGVEPAAARVLLDRGVRNVILTLGARGALLATADGVLPVPGHQVEVVDTTAAGDAFVAGFSVALAEGKDPVEAVRWANACGALAVTVLGAQPSLPTRSALDSFLGGDPAS